MSDLVERLRFGGNNKSEATRHEAAARIEALEAALRAIMKATVEGRVCDDVAWYDGITTLHDFCDITLNGPE